MVSMTCPSVKASPCQWKCEAKSAGALVTREPTMNRKPAASMASKFVVDNMPASAAIPSLRGDFRKRHHTLQVLRLREEIEGAHPLQFIASLAEHHEIAHLRGRIARDINHALGSNCSSRQDLCNRKSTGTRWMCFSC